MIDGFRVYIPAELGSDGYPLAWHGLGGKDRFALKHLVREQAGHRCVRCRHPFRVGETPGVWSPCDKECVHLGPVRIREVYRGDGSWTEYDLDMIGQPVGESLFDFDQNQRRIQRWEAEARYRVLTVHHLDGVKANCRWWNLAALCQRCHLEIQGKVKMDRPWPWPHSEWMRPHAAGFYALKYLSEDLTREQTMARLDELLEMGLAEEALERIPV